MSLSGAPGQGRSRIMTPATGRRLTSAAVPGHPVVRVGVAARNQLGLLSFPLVVVVVVVVEISVIFECSALRGVSGQNQKTGERMDKSECGPSKQ